MRFLLSLALVAAGTIVFAQDLADIFHKTIDLNSVNQVSIDVYNGDNFEIKQWPGDDILVETSVKLIGGKPFLLKFFKEKKRYELDPVVSGDRMQLTSVDKVRRKVNGAMGETIERVRIVVYMPDTFTPTGATTFQRNSR